MRVPHIPGVPVRFGEAGKLHGAFLNEAAHAPLSGAARGKFGYLACLWRDVGNFRPLGDLQINPDVLTMT